MNKAK